MPACSERINDIGLYNMYCTTMQASNCNDERSNSISSQNNVISSDRQIDTTLGVTTLNQEEHDAAYAIITMSKSHGKPKTNKVVGSILNNNMTNDNNYIETKVTKKRDAQSMLLSPSTEEINTNSTISLSNSDSPVVDVGSSVLNLANDNCETKYAKKGDAQSVLPLSSEEVTDSTCLTNSQLYCMASDKFVDMPNVKSFVGAQYPICFRDLGSTVPRDFQWDEGLFDLKYCKKKIKSELVSRINIRTAILAHCRKHHPKVLIWNIYTDVDATGDIDKDILPVIYRLAVSAIPFDTIVASDGPTNPAEIIQLFELRFKYAYEQIIDGRIISILLSRYPTMKPFFSSTELMIIASGNLLLHKLAFNKAFDESQQTSIMKLTHSQIRNLVNLFFLGVKAYKHCSPYFSCKDNQYTFRYEISENMPLFRKEPQTINK